MRRFLPAILVFAAIAAMLIVIEARPQFPDPDSFYHAKMALIVRDQGFIHQLPWLQYTVLATDYVDYHLGYHLLLVPFVTLFDPLVGMKVSAGLFGLIAFYALYRFLKWMKAPHPEILVGLAVLSSSFLHRMSLPRAPALSVAILLWCTYALIDRRPWMITASAAVYVWFYYGWPLLIPLTMAVLVADLMLARLEEQKMSFWHSLSSVARRQRRSIGQLLLGVVIGLVVNPYFPNNIFATARDVFKLAVVNYHQVIPVGMEWYPTTPEDFLVASPFLVVFFAISCALLLAVAATQKEVPRRAQMFSLFTVMLLSGGFFVLTLKSNRFIEYAVPFLTLAAGGLFTFWLPFFNRELLPGLRKWFSWRPGKWLVSGVVVLAVASFALTEVKNALPNKQHFTESAFAPVTEWIKQNIPQGELVFHNGWDFSLILFYLDDSHRYLVGLDPTYMYDAFRSDYDIWSDLVTGKDADVGKIITYFQSQVVVIDTRLTTDFEKNIQASGLFDAVIADGPVHLYSAK